MVQFTWKNHGRYGIAVLVALFALFAFWIRILPMFTVGHTEILDMVAMDDPMYNLRQVEVMLAGHGYSWFDPMTTYPSGTTIYWGPLFTMIVSLFCIVTGATTRPEIIGSALLVTPLIAAATVVVMYFVGRVFGDWKTGLLSAGFTAAMGGQYLIYSIYGYIDHHIAEVLFSTLFCLAYGYALASERDRKIDIHDGKSYRQTIFLSVLCGIAYLLGLFVMPTMILFAMIAGVFTLIQFTFDFSRGRSSDYLLLINGTTFLVATAGLLVFGLKSTVLDLASYSAGHLLAYTGLVAGTFVLWYLARILRGKAWYYYPGVLAGSGIVLAALLYIVSQPLYTLFVYDLYAFFGQAPVTNTVEEAMGWSVAHAWDSFNYSLLLLAGGILVFLYRNIRDERPQEVFALVWALVMLLATWQHIRYEYYLAICIALLSAVCVGSAIDIIRPALAGHAGSLSPPGGAEPESGDRSQRSRKKMAKDARRKEEPVSPSAIPKVVLALLVFGFALMFVYTSVSESYGKMTAIGPQMISDWKESMQWMGNNTPETGMDYYASYDPATFHYPPQSYGVMSWWDYGHMITYIAKRIPNANPFQQGVAGPDGAAAYFVATDEDAANRILDHDGTRFVVTDILMDDIMTGKFHAMATWYNSTADIDPFSIIVAVPDRDNGTTFQPAMLLRQEYYLTMVSRLHNFDGSMTGPSKTYYLEYADPTLTGIEYPVVIGGSQMNGTEAAGAVAMFNANATAGKHAGVFSSSILNPVGTVPALRHYRLVHESPTNVYNSAAVNVKFVKVFEYVKGAHIRGSGIISLPLVTDTGRHFTYRQESVNGEFIVPYSTTGNTYGVTAAGKYTIEGTGQTFDVPEIAVMQGTAIN